MMIIHRCLFKIFQAQTQNTPFVDYMLQLQRQTESNYDSIMETFRDVRHQLSSVLILLNNAGVAEFTDGEHRNILTR